MAELIEADVHTTIGALLIGTLISCGLFGMSIVQIYIYCRRYPRDKSYLKVLVAVVWICQLGHTLCISHAFYVLSVDNFGDPSSLSKAPISLSISVIFLGIIAPAVQMFFANRIRIVCGTWLIPAICCVLSVARFALNTLASIMAIRMTSLLQFVTEWKWLVATLSAAGFSVDLTMAATLSYYLRNSKFINHEKKIATLDKLVAWTIQNGLLTMAVEVAFLSCFLTNPRNYIWLGLMEMLPMTFSCSLMASLNGRTLGQETIIELSKMAPDTDRNYLSQTTISVSIDGFAEAMNKEKEKFPHDGTYFPHLSPQDEAGMTT